MANAQVEMEIIGKRLALAYPVTNRDLVPEVQTFTQFFIGRECGHALRDHVGRRRVCAPDRVRQSGEPDARSRAWQLTRGFGPYRARRGTVADHPAASDREHDAVGAGRFLRLVYRQLGRARLSGRDGFEVVLADPELLHGLTRAWVSDRHFDRNGIGLRTRARAAVVAAGCQRDSQGRRPRRHGTRATPNISLRCW